MNISFNELNEEVRELTDLEALEIIINTIKNGK